MKNVSELPFCYFTKAGFLHCLVSNSLVCKMKFLPSVSASLLALGLSLGATAQKSDALLRYPDLSPDGKQVAFSYQGDIWTVPVEGGRAFRLTIHEGYESMPRFSPDGKQIAFNSDRFGNEDIFVMAAEGGFPQRLTYHTSNDILGGWTNDGRLIFSSRRDYAQAEWGAEFHTVSVQGGTPERFLDAIGYTPAVSADGRLVAYVQGYNNPERKRYRGSANREIFVFDTKTKTYTQITSFAGNDMHPQWAGNTLFFISERDESYNLFRLTFEDGKPKGEPQQLTQLKDDGVRHFGLDAKGTKAVIEQGTKILILDLETKKSEPIAVVLTQDYRFDPVEAKTYSRGLQQYQLSPNGKYYAFTIRGEIFLSEAHKEKSQTVRLTQHAFYEREPTWLNDSTLLFISDRENGQNDIFLLRSADKNQPHLFKTLKREILRLTHSDEDETNLSVSPNGKKIAFVRGRGTLVTADIDAKGKISNEKILLNGWATPSGLAWSPDSKWLAYSLEDLYFNEEIYIHAADNSQKPVNVSYHPKRDYNPVWSKDGSKLGFLSMRNNGDADVWFVWLRKKDWDKTKQDWLEYDPEEAKKEPKKDEKKDDKKENVEPIVIDFENLHHRLVQVTSLPAGESDLQISPDGETFYFVTNRQGRAGSYSADQDLYSIKWDGKERKNLTSNNTKPYAVSLSADGKYLYYAKDDGMLFRVESNGGTPENMPFAAHLTIDFEKEKEQIFGHVWKLLDQNFYDPEFHGQDWKKQAQKYKPWAMLASTERDFKDVINLMLGELNASHMGYYNTDRADRQKQKMGLIGAEVRPLKEGVEIVRVIPNSPADREESKLAKGDVILSVDGEKIEAKQNFYALFANKTEESKVVLEVKDAKGNLRQVILRPASSLRTELYEEWVAERKALTEKYSKGRLGYIHIEGMNWESFERFERELAASGEGKEGIVIDVRFNGGGWTTDYLMAVLTVKQHAYTIPRGATESFKNHKQFENYYPYGERLPFAAWVKPSITLCNEHSYSNAEIFVHAYKENKLGKVVGMPTFGAVISTGSASLIDGSLVRLPFRAWFVKSSGKNMENSGAEPDIILQNSPDGKAKGEDEQLKKAVEELLKDIK
jgi:Tol biopolymer transport system component/C-terminal processing protease CtpA/Prc